MRERWCLHTCINDCGGGVKGDRLCSIENYSKAVKNILFPCHIHIFENKMNVQIFNFSGCCLMLTFSRHYT